MKFSRGLAGIAILVLGLIVSNEAQRKPSEDLTQITALLKAHDDALNKHDLDGIMSVFAAAPNTVVMGTGPGEKWQGKDEIKGAYTEIFKDFDEGTSTRECPWRAGDINGDSAWITSICKFSDSKGGKKREYELNLSGVLRKLGGKWYFQALHYSNLTGGGSGG